MVPNYFEFAYANLTHGYIYLFTDYCVALGIPIALGNFDTKPRWKCALITFVEMAVCLIAMELLAALYFTIFGSDVHIPFVCGLIVTVLYTIIRCKCKPFVRIMRASLYIGISCLGITITMSMGAILGTPYYYLQWVLICVNPAALVFAQKD